MLTHRINRTRSGRQSKALTETYYRYRGLAIRSLREDIDRACRRTSDVVLAGIMTLMLSDVCRRFANCTIIRSTAATELTISRNRYSMASRQTGNTTWAECSG